MRRSRTSRRPRAAVFTDQAFLRVGGFVLGNILTSVVAGAGTVVWALIFGLPYPLLLGLLGALVAVPIAATLQIILEQVTFPSLEHR